ncbi:MAG: MFS transporter [Firmicutes bacterium]|nr:MFS transporter [Bacillota bacterium]
MSDPDVLLLKRIRTVSSLGVLLDGYNLSVIAVALVPLTVQFRLGAAATGLLASAMLLGSIAGGLTAGVLADRFGRKTLLIWDLIIFMVFSLVSAFLFSYIWLVLARLVVGLAVGADYAISPTYLAEFAPRKTRGYQLGYVWLAWSVGAVLSFGLGAAIVGWLPPQLSWRILFALALIPAAIGLLMRRQLPESPHWLKYGAKNKADHPTKVSSRVTGLGRAWRLSLVPWFLMDFSTYGLGLLLPLLLKSNGLTSSTGAILGTGLAALFGGLGSVWAMFQLDRRGRIVLQIRGFLWSGIGLWMLAIMLWVDFKVFAVLLAGLMVVNLLNGTGPGTTCGIIPAEVFPTPMRATALGVSTAVSRVGAIVGVFFLGFIEVRFGLGAVLAATGVAALLGSVLSWVWRIEPNQTALPDIRGEAAVLISQSGIEKR